MKPKTKKTLFIMAALAVVVLIIYFVFFGKAPKGTAKGYIDRLTGVNAETKKAIKGYLSKAAIEQDINANASSNGINYEQALALTAAYYLVNSGVVDDATWQDWKAQIKAMQ